MGLVYNPVLEDMYTAIRGQGAFCNGKKIRVTEGGISEAVINCGCAYLYLLSLYFTTNLHCFVFAPFNILCMDTEHFVPLTPADL